MCKRIYNYPLLLLIVLLNPSELLSVQADQFEEQTIYNNWLNVQERTQLDTTDANTTLYNRLSENYYALFKITDNTVYLRYALFEAGREKREEIISELTESELSDVEETINILNGIINSETYSIRPFSPDDLYLFMMVQIPEDLKEDAKALLNHWHETLSRESFDEFPLRSALIIQALVYGYDDLRDFNKAYEASNFLINSNPLPNSTFTYNLYNRIAFSARVSGYYSNALKIYEEILLPLASNLGFKERLLTTKMSYALTLFRIGNVRNALYQFENIYNDNINNLTPRA
ncbi:MAG: hypothetical protein RI575_17610, partial [Balneolaceae bacterium]|nr:hypothetical protein [Balneolaceae bacterium]